MATAPELVDSLEEVRPLARALALELVRQELAGLRIGLNGSALSEEIAANGHQAPQDTANGAAAIPDLPAPVRRCNSCQRELPAAAFEKHRGTCRQCRHRQQTERERQRREAATADEDERGLAPA